jgi:hypothetical protein
VEEGNGYSYSWIKVDKDGNRETVDGANTYQLIVDVAKIISYSTYKCTVKYTYTKDEVAKTTLVGTASITIYNSLEYYST